MFTRPLTGVTKLLADDIAEIGTLECRLSSNLYGSALNKVKGLYLVCVASNLRISGREEAEFTGILQTQ